MCLAHLHHPFPLLLLEPAQDPASNLAQSCRVLPKHARLEPRLRDPYPLNVQVELICLLQIVRVEALLVAAVHEGVDQSILGMGTSGKRVVLGKRRVVLQKLGFDIVESVLVLFFGVRFVVAALESQPSSRCMGAPE